MAIPTSNIRPDARTSPNIGMAYVLWGSLYVPGANYKFSDLFSTVNFAPANRASNSMAGRTQGAAVAIAGKYNMGAILQNGSQTMNITATCAWTAAIGSGNFSITNINGQVLLSGGGGAGSVVGGSGTLVIKKTGAQSSTGQVNFTWSGGAGNSITQGVALT